MNTHESPKRTRLFVNPNKPYRIQNDKHSTIQLNSLTRKEGLK